MYFHSKLSPTVLGFLQAASSLTSCTLSSWSGAVRRSSSARRDTRQASSPETKWERTSRTFGSNRSSRKVRCSATGSSPRSWTGKGAATQRPSSHGCKSGQGRRCSKTWWRTCRTTRRPGRSQNPTGAGRGDRSGTCGPPHRSSIRSGTSLRARSVQAFILVECRKAD